MFDFAVKPWGTSPLQVLPICSVKGRQNLVLHKVVGIRHVGIPKAAIYSTMPSIALELLGGS